MQYVVTVQYAHETYQPIVFGPFATRIQAAAWIDRQVNKSSSNHASFRVTLLETTEDLPDHLLTATRGS